MLSQPQQQEQQCSWTQSYAEGTTWIAYQAQDVVYASGPDILDAASPCHQQFKTLPTFPFGCINDNDDDNIANIDINNDIDEGFNHTTTTQRQRKRRKRWNLISSSSSSSPSFNYLQHQWANGILGLSNGYSMTLPQQLYQHGKMISPLFSLCFRSLRSIHEEGEGRKGAPQKTQRHEPLSSSSSSFLRSRDPSPSDGNSTHSRRMIQPHHYDDRHPKSNDRHYQYYHRHRRKQEQHPQRYKSAGVMTLGDVGWDGLNPGRRQPRGGEDENNQGDDHSRNQQQQQQQQEGGDDDRGNDDRNKHTNDEEYDDEVASRPTHIVYAQNIQPSGLYTLQIRQMYLKIPPPPVTPTKTSPPHRRRHWDTYSHEIPIDDDDDDDDDDDRSITHIPQEHLQILNSGKGMIIDSGSTGTYFHHQIFPYFEQALKKIATIPTLSSSSSLIKHFRVSSSSQESSSASFALTWEELQQLPTIWMHFRSADYQEPTKDRDDGDDIDDRSSSTTWPLFLNSQEYPNDMIWKIPPEHYMEYNPISGLYIPRLYFTKSRGGILGANAMQRHVVVFDALHSRIGIAPSNCEYAESGTEQESVIPDVWSFKENEEIKKEEVSKSIADNIGKVVTHSSECVECRPENQRFLTTPCIESLNLDQCISASQPERIKLVGTEEWSWILGWTIDDDDDDDADCDPTGCRQRTLLLLQSTNSSIVKMECHGNGICTEIRRCQMICSEILQTKSNQTDRVDPTATTTPSCRVSLWSVCDFRCEQTQICYNEPYETAPDIYIEVSRSSRPCHIDACREIHLDDPCRVPYVVHAVLRWETMMMEPPQTWTMSFLQEFQTIVTQVSHMPQFSSIAARRKLFSEGDVQIVSVTPWDEDEEEEEEDEIPARVFRIVFQVSIADERSNTTYFMDHPSRRVSGASSSSWRLLSYSTQLWETLLQPFQGLGYVSTSSTCDPIVLFPLAKDAVELADGIFKHPVFGDYLTKALTSRNMGSQAKIMSSWITGVKVYEDPMDVRYYHSPVLEYLGIAGTYLTVLYVALWISIILFVISMMGWFYPNDSSTTYHRWIIRILRFKACCKPKWYTQHVKQSEDDIIDDKNSLDSPLGSLSSTNGHSHHHPRRRIRNVVDASGESHLVVVKPKRGRTPTKRYSATRQVNHP